MLEQNRPPALMSGENDENARSQILIGVGFVFCLLFDVSSSHPILPLMTCSAHPSTSAQEMLLLLGAAQHNSGVSVVRHHGNQLR